MQLYLKVNLTSVFSMGYFSSWDMRIAGHGARHPGHGQRLPLVLGSALLWEDGNSPTRSAVGGFGIFFCSLFGTG